VHDGEGTRTAWPAAGVHAVAVRWRTDSPPMQARAAPCAFAFHHPLAHPARAGAAVRRVPALIRLCVETRDTCPFSRALARLTPTFQEG